jgi:hypothetical protein
MRTARRRSTGGRPEIRINPKMTVAARAGPGVRYFSVYLHPAHVKNVGQISHSGVTATVIMATISGGGNWVA